MGSNHYYKVTPLGAAVDEQTIAYDPATRVETNIANVIIDGTATAIKIEMLMEHDVVETFDVNQSYTPTGQGDFLLDAWHYGGTVGRLRVPVRIRMDRGVAHEMKLQDCAQMLSGDGPVEMAMVWPTSWCGVKSCHVYQASFFCSRVAPAVKGSRSQDRPSLSFYLFSSSFSFGGGALIERGFTVKQADIIR